MSIHIANGFSLLNIHDLLFDYTLGDGDSWSEVQCEVQSLKQILPRMLQGLSKVDVSLYSPYLTLELLGTLWKTNTVYVIRGL